MHICVPLNLNFQLYRNNYYRILLFHSLHMSYTCSSHINEYKHIPTSQCLTLKSSQTRMTFRFTFQGHRCQNLIQNHRSVSLYHSTPVSVTATSSICTARYSETNVYVYAFNLTFNNCSKSHQMVRVVLNGSISY